MTMSYSILTHQRLVVARCFGVVEDAEGPVHMRTLGEDPAFDPTFDEITDCRDITDNRVTMEGLKAASALSPFDPTSRHAIVVGTPLEHGRARQFSMLSTPTEELYRVTDDLYTAMDWLGVADRAEVLRTFETLRER